MMDRAKSHEQYHDVTQEASHEAAADRTAPAAASLPAAPATKYQPLSTEIEAAIQTLPAEHQKDARQVCREEDSEDQPKLDALLLFGRKLGEGKADNCGWLRNAVKGDWGAKERIKEQQEGERREQQEAAKRAEAEKMELAEAKAKADQDEAYRRYLRLSQEHQKVVKEAAYEKMQQKLLL
ncbi:hypothetical protein [Trichlorobacter lovleyi]|uniref:hypothetical protein n=1 Tax=Trichlorobacter lovleyi TaxID=313985 RepID=UPI00223F020B|nr:hypothetical protein [Trichlorobacter lovleyi]